MPLEIITESVFGLIFRALGWIFIDVLFEILIRGLGYLICRPFNKIDFDSWVCIVMGLLGWTLIGFLIYGFFYF